MPGSAENTGLPAVQTLIKGYTMIGFLKQLIDGEQGQALPIVLALLVLGGLTIAPSLNYAATSLNSSQAIEKGMKGLYAADAGVEDTLWCLENGISPSQQLPESINHMEVAIQTEEEGIHTLYFGQLVQAGEHSDYLSVDGEIVWDEEAEAYQYTITVTWQPLPGASVIHLEEVGARLPMGYSYQPGSAASFANNLSITEPDEVLDSSGAYMLNWEWGEPYPSVSQDNPIETQTFYITGEGDLEGDYTWVVASRTDIGGVGELTGTLYIITTTATQPESGEITAKIVADVVMEGGTIHIVSWQVSK